MHEGSWLLEGTLSIRLRFDGSVVIVGDGLLFGYTG